MKLVEEKIATIIYVCSSRKIAPEQYTELMVSENSFQFMIKIPFADDIVNCNELIAKIGFWFVMENFFN